MSRSFLSWDSLPREMVPKAPPSQDPNLRCLQLSCAQGVLQCTKMHAFVECFTANSFVRISATFKTPAEGVNDVLLRFPTTEDTTVTSVRARADNRHFVTEVVPIDEAAKLHGGVGNGAKSSAAAAASSQRSRTPDFGGTNKYTQSFCGEDGKVGEDFAHFNPHVFRMWFASLEASTEIHVDLCYMVPVWLSDSIFSLHVPLQLSEGMYNPQVTAVRDLVEVQVRLQHTREMETRKWGCVSHSLLTEGESADFVQLVVQWARPGWVSRREAYGPQSDGTGGLTGNTEEGATAVAADAPRTPSEDPDNQDFLIAYQCSSRKVVATCLLEPGSAPDQNHFVVFITPPVAVTRPMRTSIFLLDISGSMVGQPLEDAKEAVKYGLRSLRPDDHFAIIAFNHLYSAFCPPSDTGGRSDGFGGSPDEGVGIPILPVVQQNLDFAIEFVDSLVAEGGTNILDPLNHAIETLRVDASSSGYITLITDGAVVNERKIVLTVAQYLRSLNDKVRISTFGIGPYCNRYFLKLLALSGRGIARNCLNPRNIRTHIQRLIHDCDQPVAHSLRFDLNREILEFQPDPIPQLFANSAFVIGGRYTSDPGAHPSRATLTGTHSSDFHALRVDMEPRISNTVPVSRIFLKAQMDTMTAKAWLDNDKRLVQQAIATSVLEQVPCAHTTLMSFETTSDHASTHHSSVSGSTDESFPLDSEFDTGVGFARPKKVKPLGVAGIAALGFGVATIIGVTSYAVGSLAATQAGASTVAAMNELMSRGMPSNPMTTCCECGEIDCTPCRSCTEGCCGESGGNACNCMGDTCSPCGDFMSPMGDLFADCWDASVEICEECGYACGDCCGECSDLVGGLDACF